VEKDDEKRLAIRNYARSIFAMAILSHPNKAGKPEIIPKPVALNAMAYIRRYFHFNPEALALECCPEMILLSVAALYLAGKIEEEPLPRGDRRGVDIDALVRAVKPVPKGEPAPKAPRMAEESLSEVQQAIKTQAIELEMTFLAAIDFDLICFHPMRPDVAYLEAWDRLRPLEDVELVRSDKTGLWPCVAACYYVEDLMFDFPPGVLGMASLVCAVRAVRKRRKRPENSEEIATAVRAVLLAECQVNETADKCVGVVIEVADRLEAGMGKEKDARAKAAYLAWRGGAHSPNPSFSPSE
jgi:hypothetical protein